jgi:predicted GNAT superfamily acetyltransferase
LSVSQLADPASSSARVDVRNLQDLDELGRVDHLFGEIWGAAGGQVAMPVNLLQAVNHAGGYVAGAWQDGRMVGAAVGFLGRREGVMHLHSHVAGVARDAQGRGVGTALKLHQRDWARSAGIGRITWTYDPLVRRNGWFNLTKLGARAVAYYPNFYGSMVDRLNGSDETDRCLVHWELDTGPGVIPPAQDEAVRLLDQSADQRPTVVDPGASWSSEAVVLVCRVPTDIVSMRANDPGLAREWRLALRQTMGRAMRSGYTATAMTPDGWYILERQED